ncbi:MAG TPA: SAP domain-containing protein [Dehalococcoidia bacterium]|nr:SAP domain-containing protein [Dehalococcoidia bacterium]
MDWHTIAGSSAKTILSALDTLSPKEQVLVDMDLHRRYIEASKNKMAIEFLKKDTLEKQKILDIFEGKNKNPEDIKNAIGVLTRDQKIHQFWAARGGRFGGKEWNNKWISIYDNWKSQLTDFYNQAVKGIIIPKAAPSMPFYWYSIPELKQICQQRGLSTEGSKEDLIRRVRR